MCWHAWYYNVLFCYDVTEYPVSDEDDNDVSLLKI